MLKALAPFAAHLAGQARALAALFVLGLCGAAVSLATPLLGKAFVDAVATDHAFGVVPWIAAALVALGVLDVALGAWTTRLHARVSAEVLARLRAALFQRCLEAPLDRIERIRHGDLLTRFGSDVPRIQVLLVDGAIGGVQSVLFLAIAAAITFTLSPVLALWSFLGVLFALLATHGFRRQVEARTRRVRERMADLSHFLAERLAALRAIRLHRALAAEQDALASANERLNREVVGFQSFDALAKGAPALLMTAALAWVYVLGGQLLESGSITLGTFVAFVLYQGRLFGPAQGLLGLVRNVQESRVSVARVVEVLEGGRANMPGTRSAGVDVAGVNVPAQAPRGLGGARDRSTDDVPTQAPAIALRHVAFAYPGKPALLAGIDLCIRAGERVALFGASGAGKSTLVQLLFGLREPDCGVVAVEGRHAGELAQGVLAYAGAEPFLMHASIEDNVRYANPPASRADLERALVVTEAAAFVKALPHGLDTVVGGRGLALSDGQRQRIGMARAILGRPRILVLDEAFSALDLDTEARVRSRLWAALPGTTVLAISHRPCGLDEFDRIVFLHDGRLTRVTPVELRTLVGYEGAWT